MEENKSSNKLTIVAFLSIVALAFLVVFTNSKFQEAVGIASDSGRVAFFLGDGSMTYELPGEEIAPGETITLNFSVANHIGNDVTEVATKYTVAIDNGNDANPLGSLPLVYTLSRTDKNDDPQSLVLNEENEFSYTSGVIPPGSITGEQIKQEYELAIYWPVEQNDRMYDNQLKISRLTFKVEQVD